MFLSVHWHGFVRMTWSNILVYDRSMVIVKMVAVSYSGLDLYFFVIVSGISIWISYVAIGFSVRAHFHPKQPSIQFTIQYWYVLVLYKHITSSRVILCWEHIHTHSLSFSLCRPQFFFWLAPAIVIICRVELFEAFILIYVFSLDLRHLYSFEIGWTTTIHAR